MNETAFASLMEDNRRLLERQVELKRDIKVLENQAAWLKGIIRDVALGLMSGELEENEFLMEQVNSVARVKMEEDILALI
jgi:hypothetical protein